MWMHRRRCLNFYFIFKFNFIYLATLPLVNNHFLLLIHVTPSINFSFVFVFGAFVGGSIDLEGRGSLEDDDLDAMGRRRMVATVLQAKELIIHG